MSCVNDVSLEKSIGPVGYVSGGALTAHQSPCRVGNFDVAGGGWGRI